MFEQLRSLICQDQWMENDQMLNFRRQMRIELKGSVQLPYFKPSLASESSTWRSLENAQSLHKVLGKPTSVKFLQGLVPSNLFVSAEWCEHPEDPDPLNHTFSGFGWGYRGNGSEGLRQYLSLIEAPPQVARLLDRPWLRFSRRCSDFCLHWFEEAWVANPWWLGSDDVAGRCQVVLVGHPVPKHYEYMGTTVFAEHVETLVPQTACDDQNQMNTLYVLRVNSKIVFYVAGKGPDADGPELKATRKRTREDEPGPAREDKKKKEEEARFCCVVM
eukprot:TRINITY_DN10682_c0_g1_i1.p1 TRINITY_DN10682_c0_g1~~TRINITY_DN10682_c0_g1_i1.p1  ORF type:complete len:274 (-),score=26.76 TRINITY_DN10682_c0_g1_i1:44-865(-)